MKFIITVLCFLLGFSSYSQDVNFECVKNNIFEIDEISSKENFSDIQFLKNILQGKKIVLLGEAGHQDGTTFLMKTALIKYLVEEHGFNTLALEGGSFSNLNNPNLDSKLLPSALLKMYWYPLWSYSKETSGLLAYLDEMQSSSPVKIVGIDPQMDFGNSFDFIDSINVFFGKQGYVSDYIDWNVLRSFKENHDKAIYDSRSGKEFSKTLFPSEWEWLELKNNMEKLKEIFESSPSHLFDNVKSLYFLKCINNALHWSKRFLSNLEDIKEQDKMIKERDLLMFENLMWYVNKYPEEKIIVWSANFHIAHSLDKIIYTPDSSFYKFMIPLGHHVKEQFEEKSYNIAFTSDYYNKAMEDAFTFERFLFDETDSRYVFINTESMQESCKNLFFRSEILGNIHKGQWFRSFDGVFFIRNMYRSTF